MEKSMGGGGARDQRRHPNGTSATKAVCRDTAAQLTGNELGDALQADVVLAAGGLPHGCKGGRDTAPPHRHARGTCTDGPSGVDGHTAAHSNKH